MDNLAYKPNPGFWRHLMRRGVARYYHKDDEACFNTCRFKRTIKRHVPIVHRCKTEIDGFDYFQGTQTIVNCNRLTYLQCKSCEYWTCTFHMYNTVICLECKEDIIYGGRPW